ncbi:MAG TPA: prolyl oligopeptidase family serine peptidase [Gemmatimonadaceae bacterium]|nr:prolyl oligopeptidase family serine peptidase [Gemmatimonadaceae bacterium]
MRRVSLPLAAVLVIASAAALGAQAPKRLLTPTDWDHWMSITGTVISNDGHWVAYSLTPQVGDGELVLRTTTGATEYRLPRGFIGRPVMTPGAAPTGRGGRGGVPGGQIAPNSKYAVALTYAPMAAFDSARHSGRGGRAGPPPKAKLAIVDLATGNVTTVADVRSFQLPSSSGDWLAYQLDADSAAGGNGANGRGGRGGATADSSGGRRKTPGSTLVLRNLVTGAQTEIEHVASYAFDDSAKWLGYAVSTRDGAGDGAYVRVPGAAASTALMMGKGDYRDLAFDRAGAQVAFVSDRDDYAARDPHFTLYYTPLKDAKPVPVATAGTLGRDLLVADYGRVAFTRTGSAIEFGVAPPRPDTVPHDSLYDKAIFDLWTWKDAELIPQQKSDAARDRDKTFLVLYHIGARKLVQLTDDSVPSATVSPDGRVAMETSGVPYAIESMWGDGGNDVYAVDATTGRRTLVKKDLRGERAALSAGGKFITYMDGGHWYAYDLGTGRTADLTGALHGNRFDDEMDDHPDIAPAYGIGGWTMDDRTVLLYDRYDVWEVDPTGARAPVVATDSLGRREHLRLRVVDLDRDDPFLDPRQPVLLSAFNEDTKAAGFYWMHLGARATPAKIVMADADYGTPIQAKHAKELVVTRGTFEQFPDLYTGTDLARIARISDANPQQAQFNWGTAELVHWTSADGIPLEGILYKPENFDPSRKYPMITYYYERLSDNLYHYVPPGGRNIINPTHYVSNGYLIFEPDIPYEIGYPGPSAMKAIVPGVEALLARGYVDPNALGIQGHSWGGYQTAYLITQTHMFKAAMAGAPVADMFSAYGGIRWQSGLNRSFQYEHTQSRIGGSIWQEPLRYLENSPLFWVDRIQTPLLIMHNDGDGAVPWYQGIEMYVALRRLGKEVYLVDYNGDEHNPTKRANQMDIAMRMQEFFDYHLRGFPEPGWMIHGIPYLQKGRDQLGHPAGVPPAPSGGDGGGAPAHR